MKGLIRILLVALAFGATGAYAESTRYNSQQSMQYDSQSATGNSANWGVGG